jgi:hypothetical protein
MGGQKLRVSLAGSEEARKETPTPRQATGSDQGLDPILICGCQFGSQTVCHVESSQRRYPIGGHSSGPYVNSWHGQGGGQGMEQTGAIGRLLGGRAWPTSEWNTATSHLTSIR